MKIWFAKRWRAQRAGTRDAQRAIGYMRGRKAAPFVQDLLAEWEEERNQRLAEFYHDQERLAGRWTRIPIMADVANDAMSPDERRQAIAHAGAQERARLEAEGVWHELASCWSRYARVLANYIKGFHERLPDGLDLPAELLHAQGFSEELDDHGWTTRRAALPMPYEPEAGVNVPASADRQPEEPA